MGIDTSISAAQHRETPLASGAFKGFRPMPLSPRWRRLPCRERRGPARRLTKEGCDWTIRSQFRGAARETPKPVTQAPTAPTYRRPCAGERYALGITPARDTPGRFRPPRRPGSGRTRSPRGASISRGRSNAGPVRPLHLQRDVPRNKKSRPPPKGVSCPKEGHPSRRKT